MAMAMAVAIAMAVEKPQNEEMPPPTVLSRKQKRKNLKKEKRRKIRQKRAGEARIEAERLLQDPILIQKEAEAMEKERIELEIQEKLWLEREKKAQEDAERKRKEDEERRKEEEEEWMYVDDDAPPEIIWEGNEIIVRKKKVRIRRSEYQKTISDKDDQPVSNPLAPMNTRRDHERPVSNPLPPQMAAFEEQKKLARSNPLTTIEQTPNFGTEQDKTHCPFHIKTGVCRFGINCSRVHVYPDKSCTLLIKNMYNGPGLPLDHDEGLEYTDEEIKQYYEEFYEDVHGEFMKYGDLVSFKVCRNESSHLRGNVYVQFKSVDSAISAYNGMNGRFYAGKQITCEFVALTRWRAALCGEYMRSRHRVCSHGTACNFLHCFRNPHGEYEWADWDNHQPKSMQTSSGRSCDREDTDWRHKHRHHSDRYSSRNGGKRTSDHSHDYHVSRKRRHEEDDHSETSSYENSILKESEGSRKDRQRSHDKRERRYKIANSDDGSEGRKSTKDRRYHKIRDQSLDRREKECYSRESSIDRNAVNFTCKDYNRQNCEQYPKVSPVEADVVSINDTKRRHKCDKRKRRHQSESSSCEDISMEGRESARKERHHHRHDRSKNQGQYGKRDKDSVERSSERGLSRKGHRKKRKHEDEHRSSSGGTRMKEKMRHGTAREQKHHDIERYKPSYDSMD